MRLIHSLEQEPLTQETQEARLKRILWAQVTQDVTITVCDVLGPIPVTDVLYRAELLIQAMVGNAAFQREHPQFTGIEMKARVAGIQSTLRRHEKIVAADPGARIPQDDAWLDDAEVGRLEAKPGPGLQKKCIDELAEA
ncbi:MAG: hypothetical protein M3Q40_01435 [Pseudomonadota bacterium]|nr:hypothetical protein [Pseudomonadota bacterium]